MKLSTDQRNIIAIQAKDRMRRELQALEHFRSAVDAKIAAWDENDSDTDYNEDKIMLASLAKFNLPENLYLNYDEGFSDKQDITDTVAMLKKIMTQRASAEDIHALVFRAYSMDEFELGWVAFGQPFGYYDRKSGSLWEHLDKSIPEDNTPIQVNHVMEGEWITAESSPIYIALCVIGGVIKSHQDESLIFQAMIAQGGVASRSIESTINDLLLGADPMQAVKDMLGDQLVGSF